MRDLITFNNDSTFTLDIDVNEVCAGVQVNAISMFFDEDCEGYELTINWTETGDEVRDDAVIAAFYLDDAFTARIAEILQENGFSKAAAEDVCTSEAGMQDAGRASYDAALLAEEVAAFMHVLLS